MRGISFKRGLVETPEEDPRAKELRAAALYLRWRLPIYRRALRLLGDPDEALDVTQESFLCLFQRLARVEDEGEAFGLLYQAASFQAISRMRRKTRWSLRLALLRPLAEDKGQEAEAQQVESALEWALVTRGASSEELTAALLHFVAGYTLEEVGEELMLSSRTVGRMLGRLRQRVHKRGGRLGDPVD